MRNHILLVTLLASLGATSGCVQTECGEGTIERNGTCEPANLVAPGADCGPHTVLVGDQCLAEYDPTKCDPTTSMPMFDPMTGLTVCIGTGGGGCGSPLACPQPAGSTKLTICGQLYDIETGEKFAAGGAGGGRCDPTMPTTSGPCALTVLAFDALVYGADQTKGNVTPTGPSDLYIDDCGRYRVANIETNGTGPYIGLGFTEAGKPPQQPLANLSVSATTGVATPKPASRVVDKFEAFIAKPTTIMAWQANGPQLATGIYVGMFRQHKPGNAGDPFARQAGVTFTKSGMSAMSQDFYTPPAQTTVSSVDAAATMTGVNGTGFLTGASVSESLIYSGTGGLGAHCQWEPHAAADIANIVFFQIFRKADITLDSQPCAD